MSYSKAKMHQIRFRLGFAPDPAEGVHSAPPDRLAGFKGPTSKWREGRKRTGKQGVWEGRPVFSLQLVGNPIHGLDTWLYCHEDYKTKFYYCTATCLISN